TLYEQHRTIADVAAAYRLRAEVGLALAPGPSLLRGLGTPTAAALLQRLQEGRHVEIVYAASLVADHGLPAQELLGLARANVKRSRIWERLEELGAAEYRAGRFADALTTLEEAVKLHGQGGTNWMKLFLAMACQQRGQSKQARSWFE